MAKKPTKFLAYAWKIKDRGQRIEVYISEDEDRQYVYYKLPPTPTERMFVNIWGIINTYELPGESFKPIVNSLEEVLGDMEFEEMEELKKAKPKMWKKIRGFADPYIPKRRHSPEDPEAIIPDEIGTKDFEYDWDSYWDYFYEKEKGEEDERNSTDN